MALNKSMKTGAACCASIGGALGASAAYADEGPAPQPVTALHFGHLIDTAAGTVLGATTIVIEGKRGARDERRQCCGARGHGDRPARSDLPARNSSTARRISRIRPARPSSSISFTGTSRIYIDR